MKVPFLGGGLGAVADVLLGAEPAAAPEAPRKRMPTNIGLNRNRPAPAARQPSARMNSGTPASAAAQRAAVNAATPRQRQATPRQQQAPRPDPYATSAPYRAPKPIYSEADYRRANEQDFDFARRAAGVATDNAIRRNQAGVQGQKELLRAQAAAQRGLNAQQNAAADRAQQRSIQANERSQNRQAGLSRDQIAANERMNSTNAGARLAAAAAQSSASLGMAKISAEAQQAIARMGNDTQRYQLDQTLAFQRQQSDPARQGLRSTSVGGRGMLNTSAMVAGVNELNLENLRGKAIAGDAGALARLQALQGGGGAGGSGGSGGGGGFSTRNYNNPEDNPALAIARENNTAAAARQAAQLASGERQQTERVQLERDRPQLQANAEEDLRKKARDAALRVFSSARPGMVPTAG